MILIQSQCLRVFNMLSSFQAAAVVKDSRPPSDWPRDGAIKFENYSTRYRKELDLVVKGIDVDIRGGEKV